MFTITDFDISEDELLTSLDHDIESCDESQSKIKAVRDEAYQYYYGKQLGNELEGRSQHVSMDVFDSVEAVKAMLMEVFTANRDICHFDDSPGRDATVDTALANEIFFRKNPGLKIIHDVIHDALLAKVGIVKRYYKEDYEFDEEEFEGLDEASFNVLGADPAIEIREVKKSTVKVAAQDVETGESIEVEQTSYAGSLLRKIDKSKVCIEVIPPERVYIDQCATSIKEAEFFSIEFSRTKGDLLADGFPKDKVDRLDDELEETHRDDIDGRLRDDWDPAETERQFVTVYESYQRRYSETLRKCLLIKAIHSKRVLLDYEIVSEAPYLEFVPIPLPHKFYGLALAEIITHTQKSNTGIKRAVLDNMFMTNTSRVVANLSLVKNPRDLLDNRAGSIIDVNAPDPSQVIKPLQVPQLNAASFQALEMMETEKEARSGASRMSRGMDSSVVSKQNSSDLITQFMNASNRRVMVMAKHLGDFMTRLLCDAFNLAVEYETAHSLEINGQMATINPSELGKRDHMSIDVALTPDEQAKEAQMLLSLDQQFSMNPNDPSMGGTYGPRERYSLFSRVFKLMNMNTPFLLSPDSPEYQQQQQQMADAQQQQAQAQEQQTQINNQITERQIRVMERQQDERDGRLRFDIIKEENDLIMNTNKQEHKEEIEDGEQFIKLSELEHKIEQDKQKLKLDTVATQAKATKDLAAADQSEETGVRKVVSESA